MNTITKRKSELQRYPLPEVEPLISKEKEKEEEKGEEQVFNTYFIPPQIKLIPKAKEGEELTIDKIIIESTISNFDPDVQLQNILQAFNKNKDTIMEPSTTLGTRIRRDEFRLVHRNNTPELIAFTNVPLRKKFFLTGVTEDLGTFKQTDMLIGAHGSYVLNVQKGNIAKGFCGTGIPILFGEGTHVIHNNTFKLDKDPIVSLNKPYIKHGTYNILRVPKGKIAKIWLGNEPYLLESKEEPYIFNTPYFSLERKSEAELFEDAFSEVIIHGSIKRLVPKTGKVAITYNNGNLVTFAAQNGEPILITKENHIFDGFLPTNTQTVVFPCEKTKALRRKERPGDLDYIEYEAMRTIDGLPIGIKLLVIYSIVDPVKTLSMLNKDQIESHIENIVVADMSMVIQRCSSSDFQNTDMTRTMPHIRDKIMNTTSSHCEPSAPNNTEFIRYLQDSVKNKLSEDFKDYGIDLVRVNIETPKILDKAIANKMAEFSLLTASANSKVSTIDQTYNIAKKEAEQLAIQNEIKQNQENQNKINVAKTSLEAAKQDAAINEVKQNQENQNKVNAAKAELEAAKLKAEAKKITATADSLANIAIDEARAKLFEEYPKLFEYEMAKLQSIATSNIKTTVISPEIAQSLLTFGTTYPFAKNSE